MEPNYFTCTLGQAASLGIQQPHKTTNDFIDAQAKRIPDAPAVGFPQPGAASEDEWDYLLFTFQDVLKSLRRTATHLSKRLPEHRSTVALLSPSTPEFLFTWLALMRLGHAVLLIAPQCQPSAIAHLCRSCHVNVLIHDEVYLEQATEASNLFGEQTGSRLDIVDLPVLQQLTRDGSIAGSHSEKDVAAAKVQETDVAYLHHTSGTSSGMPKPIPQTHRAGLGVLPSFQDGARAATFTTTPLYHGGIADLFRAWTSGALIWLFPGKKVPITATNVVKCLDVTRNTHEETPERTAPVKYFSSVPYVLQLIESTPRGLEYLRTMSIVGVGGAALPPEVGDRLVQSGVNLISRFGSAECGFLLSSHRDFSADNEWQYLRPSKDSHLTFESAADGLAELIVQPGWPHMAKRNREDGSYATSDLFAPHPTIEGAWRYHSRADSQMTLITGKKFDPAPLEAAIATAVESRDVLEDVLIFGNGMPYPGMLLFKSKAAESMNDEDVRERVWKVVEKLNSEAQDHARVPQSMLVPMRTLETPLEKSSKGTILRGAVEKRFQAEIEGAYIGGDEMNGEQEQVSDEQLPQKIQKIVEGVVRRKGALTATTDLFSYGVDSVAGMQIRQKLRRLLPEDASQVPINVVEDCGSVAKLAQYVQRRRRGESGVEDAETNANEHDYMRQLVDEYSRFREDGNGTGVTHMNNGQQDGHGSSDVVVLTGATGALGAHILDQYRAKPSVSRIYCLVRGADEKAAHERVNKALVQRRLSPLDDNGKFVVLQAQLSDPNLGLEKAMYDRLASEATVIMHVAWSVNFRMKLRSFVRDSIAGVTHLINLALASPQTQAPPRFAFCSSVASMMAYHDNKGGAVPEVIVDDPASATELGYSKSKWVAEHICQRASERTKLKGRVAVFRVGQLAGDRVHGVWNTKEAWPMMLSAVKVTGSLPALEHEKLDWLPVDIAAAALIEGAEGTAADSSLRMFHVVNENSKPTWMDLLQWLRKHEAFEIVPPGRWVEQLDSAASNGSNHPALQLLDHWKKAFLQGEKDGVDGSNSTQHTDITTTATFSMERTKQALVSLRHVEPVSEEYFGRLWLWIKGEM